MWSPIFASFGSHNSSRDMKLKAKIKIRLFEAEERQGGGKTFQHFPKIVWRHFEPRLSSFEATSLGLLCVTVVTILSIYGCYFLLEMLIFFVLFELGTNPAVLTHIGYTEYQEAYNFAQQTGVFEVRRSENVTRGKVLRQVVLHAPVHWCPIILSQPVGVIGNYQWFVVYRHITELIV